MTHNSYGVGVKYVANEWAGFVYYLSQDAPFVSLVRGLCFRSYSFPGELTRFRDSSVTLEEEQFFSKLVGLKSMDEIKNLLDSIEDTTQRQTIYHQINIAYKSYQQLLSKIAPIDIKPYTQTANQWVNKQTEILKKFFNKVATLYRVGSFPWDNNLVYPCVNVHPNFSNKVMVFYNVIFLPITTVKHTEENFHRILSILIEKYYERRSEKLQNLMNNFFSNYPSQYTYFAKQYLDEAMHNALLNMYISLEKTSNTLSKKSCYVEGFSNAIYADLSKYLTNTKQLDLLFCKAVVHHFARTFPECIYNITEVLGRCFLALKHFEASKVLEVIKKHIHICSAFYGPLEIIKNIKGPLYYFDSNSPIVAVVRQDEVKNRKQFITDYPFFKKLPTCFLKRISQEKGLYVFQKKSSILYLFFVVDDYEEVDRLSKILSEKKMFSKEKIISIILSGN